MKKALIIFLAMVLAISLVACGNKNDVTSSEELSDNPSIVESSTETTASNSTSLQEKGKTFFVPSKDVCFTVPTAWSVDEKDLSVIVSQNKDCLVAVSYDWTQSSNENLEQIIKNLSRYMLRDASGESRGVIRNSEIIVTSTRNDTVAGYDCVVFNGTIDNQGQWTCHVYGYTYIVDGIELMVCGLVSAQEQDPAMIEMIDNLTDEIAASVRIER